MGRKRNVATINGNVKNVEYTEQKNISTAVQDRLGFNDNVCQKCNARNASNLDKCRKCGSKQLRRKASDYRGKGSENS